MSRKYKRTRPRNTRDNTKRVKVTEGSEGPKHDPYGYTEYELDGWILHLGCLGSWLKTPMRTTIECMCPNVYRNDRMLIRMFERNAKVNISSVDSYHNMVMSQLADDPMGRACDYE